MIRITLAPEDLTRIRFAFSPLSETVLSFRVLSDPARYPIHLPWIKSTRQAVRHLPLELLATLVRPQGYMPDFLTPPPASPQ